VKSVSTGRRFFTPEISESVVERFLGTRRHEEHADGRLTPRENEILRHLANGRGNKEIAALLGITVRTVETYRSKIMLKLGLHSLAELIHYAMRNEIISVKGTG
jgi:DNA-binding NarL/FixJ family response regulator